MVAFSLFRSASRRSQPKPVATDDDHDKQWAKKYILDPLTAPEPSQETGLGTSHINPHRTNSKSPSPPPRSESQARPQNLQQLKPRQPSSSSREDLDDSSVDLHYPTPPSSASPSNRASFHPSNPFSTPSHRSRSQADSLSEEAIVTPPGSPPFNFQNQARRESNSHSSRPPPTNPQYRRHRRFQSVPVTRALPGVWGDDSEPENPHRHPDPAAQRRQSTNTRAPVDINQPNRHRRLSSLTQRFPGDMSHRPLDMIKNDAKAADRPYRHRKRISETDTIDALDTIGGPYHHGGPYDATLTSRNLNKKYSPVAAVEHTNQEAIRATPRENIIDSLTRHVPLQGTASIPVGGTDLNGNVMTYEEGADLMREADAAGGPYKRWDGIQYHPEDLKGKGEPSFTIERDLKKTKGHRYHQSEPNAYEMRSGVNRNSNDSPITRHRSVSHATHATSSGAAYNGDNGEGEMRRSNTTGKKLGEGLKKRFGSLRRKKDLPSAEVH